MVGPNLPFGGLACGLVLGPLPSTVLVPVGSNLTREVPTPPLGNPGTDTTHEGATPRGEPRARYERKVDTLPR